MERRSRMRLSRVENSPHVQSYTWLPRFRTPFHCRDRRHPSCGMWKVIAYASRGLHPTERNMENYSTMKLELLALKWAVADKFRDYLLGSTFTDFTDNNPLTYLKTAKLGAVELRWAAQLADFEFDIVHRTGKSNANADALSRRGTIGDVREQFRIPEPMVIPSEIRESYTVLVQQSPLIWRKSQLLHR